MKLPIVGPKSTFNLTNDIWNGPNHYIDDYRNVIKQREAVRIPYLHHSPQIKYRKCLVEYLKKFSSEKRLTHTCLSLAVYILDIFMDNHTILIERLHLVANVCLLLAAKFEENIGSIPKIVDLNLASNTSYSIKDYNMVELLVLKFFDWYLILPTPAHYIHYFMQFSITTEDLYIEARNYRNVFYDLDEYIRLYLDKVLEDVRCMHQYKPSVLAAAIISASRERIGLQCWTEQLEKITQLSKQHIWDAVQALLM